MVTHPIDKIRDESSPGKSGIPAPRPRWGGAYSTPPDPPAAKKPRFAQPKIRLT